MLGPQPQLALSVEFLVEFPYVGAQPQLALSVEILVEFPYVGAPTPTCFVCRNSR